jgi:Subtilase family
MEVVRAPNRQRQGARLGPKFERLEAALARPEQLAEYQEDPAAIVPERALVFEVASDVVDFYRALRGLPGFELLGEDEAEAEADENFFLTDRHGVPVPEKRVPRRLYFTIPDHTALEQMLSLWRRYQRGEPLGRGRTAWRDVFGHLDDLRRWGPQDRLTHDVVSDWNERLREHPETPIPFEVELWYYNDQARRERGEAIVTQTIEDAGGSVRHRSVIDVIRYHAVLAEVAPDVVRRLLANPDVSELLTVDDVMVLRPQSMVAGPVEGLLEDGSSLPPEQERALDARQPVVGLLDGVPMTDHSRLVGKLDVDDPDDLAARYGRASEQRHGTAMASLILHGDLNAPAPSPPIRRPLYVRPIMYSQHVGFDEPVELMPPDQLAVDVIWRAFLRMYEGEGDAAPTAPNVRIVNLSVGDEKRRFAGPMSPWARLLDYLAWRHNVLVIVSAGNIPDPVPLDELQSWSELVNATPPDRQQTIVRSVLRQRAHRSLLAPGEAVNALTVGAAHGDHVAPNGNGVLALDPYVSPYLPNVSSALGLGFRRTVKPELLLPGGAEQVRTQSTQAPILVRPVAQPSSFFGVGVATPGPAGETNRRLNMSGTSVATALATHSALRILEALEELPDDPVHPAIDPQYHSVILKALLVHGARWDTDTVSFLKAVLNGDGPLNWQHEREELSRILGFGTPAIERVLDCTETRATLVGWGTLRDKEIDRYRIPLPGDLEGLVGFRALSVTIAWLTPVNALHRMYRVAKLAAEPGGDKGFSLAVSNAKHQPTHNAVGRGTTHHQRWEGEKAGSFVDDGYLLLDVGCSAVAGELDEAVPYAVVASLEVGAEVGVPVYEQVRARLREAVRVAT